MNPPDDPSIQVPIATPDGRVAPAPAAPAIDRNNWDTAPRIVRSTRLLNAVMAVIYIIIVVAQFLRSPHSADSAEEVGRITGCIMIIVLAIGLPSWLAQEFRKGNPKAWSVQIAFSALGLLNCPLGTLINGYILSQWFRPDVKVWFGRS